MKVIFRRQIKIAFEQYIGKQLDRFPDDIFIWNTDGTKRTGTYYKKWWEFRSMVIRNFVERVRTEIKNIKPDIHLEYWAAFMDSCYLWARTKRGIHRIRFFQRPQLGFHLNIKIQVLPDC
ncbi:hypothetical protein NXW94_30345 [Bacteroides ovatus]|nr:hypothetical protein [Bacteroides ovatus]